MKIISIVRFLRKSIKLLFTRKFKDGRAHPLQCIAWILTFLLLVGLASSVYFVVQGAVTERHKKQISDAKESYRTDELDTVHFRAGQNYRYRYYEDAFSDFTKFLDKFPSILITENNLDSDSEKSNKVDEAIIKIVLSLRKLNRNDEISSKIKDFTNRFPNSKLAGQNSILYSYHNGLDSLYVLRPKRLDDVKFFRKFWDESKSYTDWHYTEKYSELARKTVKDAREAFEKLLTYALLNEPPYSELKGEALYFIAKSFLIEGNYRQAYIEFDRIATIDFRNYPDLQDEAMYYTAYCLKVRGIHDEALGRYTEFMMRFPNSKYVTDAYFDLGQIYAIQKQYDNARVSYESALQREKKQSRKVENELAELKIISKGPVNHALDEYKKVVDRYRKLSLEYPEDSFFAETLYSISKFPEKPKNWNDIQKKINEYEDLVRKHGRDREAKFQASIGRAFYDQGNDEGDQVGREKPQSFYQKAIDNYNTLLSEYPKSPFSPTAKLIIANIYNKLDKQKESVKAYQRIIDDFDVDYKKEGEISVTINGYSKRTDPRVFATYEIGEAYSEMQDPEQALEWHRKIIEKNGFNSNDSSDGIDFRKDALAPDALYSSMKTLAKLKRYAELETVATTYIEELRKDKPVLSAEAQFNFAHIKHLELKQYQNAVLEYKKLNEQFAENENGEVSGYLPRPDLWFNLGKLHGKYSEGLCYEELAKQKDNNSDSFPAETYKEATTLFKTVFQPLINDPNIDVEERDFYIVEATKIFMELVNRYPGDENAAYWQYLAGEFYFAKKDFENAIAEYQKVLKVYPTSGYVKNARDRINEIHQKFGNEIGEEIGYFDKFENSGSLGNAQTDKQLTPEDIAQKASNSTVFLGMNTGTGSGFFIAPGLIATNYHVIAESTSGYAYLIRKKLHYSIIGVVATDEERDLAILKVRAFDVPPLPFGNSDNIEVGETVYAAGSPKGHIDTISDGIVSRIRPFDTGRFKSGQMLRLKRIQITTPTSPGSSGGPLLNSNGKVIGINHAGDSRHGAENINFAIPVNYLQELFKRVGTPEPLRNFTITSR